MSQKHYKTIETTVYGTEIETDCFGNRVGSYDHKIVKIMRQARMQYDEDHSVIIFVPPEMYDEALYCFNSGRLDNKNTYKIYPKSTMRLRRGEITPESYKSQILGESVGHVDIVYAINPDEISDLALAEIRSLPTKDGILYHVYL